MSRESWVAAALMLLLLVALVMGRIWAANRIEQRCLDLGGEPAMCYATSQAAFIGR